MIPPTAAALQSEATGCFVPLPLPNSRRTLPDPQGPALSIRCEQ